MWDISTYIELLFHSIQLHHNSRHAYSEVSSAVFKGAYSQEHVYRSKALELQYVLEYIFIYI